MVDRIYDGVCSWPLGETQSAIFEFIGSGRPVSLSDVVAHVSLARSTVRESFTRLIARGLVHKSYKTARGRTWSVFCLTEAGIELRSKTQ